MADCTRVATPRCLQRGLHRERIHDGGQHADIVGLGALHAGGGARYAAEDVAAADHDADLHAHGATSPISVAMAFTMSLSRP